MDNIYGYMHDLQKFHGSLYVIFKFERKCIHDGYLLCHTCHTCHTVQVKYITTSYYPSLIININPRRLRPFHSVTFSVLPSNLHRQI